METMEDCGCNRKPCTQLTVKSVEYHSRVYLFLLEKFNLEFTFSLLVNNNEWEKTLFYKCVNREKSQDDSFPLFTRIELQTWL